jgi:flagellar basal-body rod modification protein FlgD
MTTPISPTGSTVAPTAGSASSGATDNTQLSSKAFLQLLVAQLQYQDPSKPVDTSSFMNETATLTQVQTMEQTAEVSAQMLSAQKAQTASSLVGHTVSYTAANGSLTTGYVSAATISTAEPTLKIGTANVDLSQIQQVLASAPTTTPTPPTT